MFHRRLFCTTTRLHRCHRSPIRHLRQRCIMLATSDKYYCISCNASNSKYLVVLPRKRRFASNYIKDCTFYVGNNPFEYRFFRTSYSHVITNQVTDIADILKSDFVGKSNNVVCFFSKLNSLIKYRLFHSYCMSLYGSELGLLSNRDGIEPEPVLKEPNPNPSFEEREPNRTEPTFTK